MHTPHHDAFLDAIYSAAFDPSRWDEVIAQFADMVGGVSGFLSALDLVTGLGPVITSRVDPQAMESYERYYAAINPLNNVEDPEAFLRDWQPAILTDEDRMAKDDLVRTEYYNDFCLRYRSHSVLMIRLRRNGSAPQVLNVSRARERGSFEAADLELADRYQPHFLRALEMGARLDADRAADSGTAALFAGSAHALFVTDAIGRVLRMNAAGDALVTAARALNLSGGLLTSQHVGVQRRLSALIGLAGRGDDGRCGGSVPLPRGEAPPLLVTVTPLPAVGCDFFQRGHTVLVCISDPMRDVPLSEGRLRESFGLTATEAKVALALVEGGDLPAAAAILGMTLNTARVHLSRIYDKTGVNRQISLTRLVLRGAALDVSAPA